MASSIRLDALVPELDLVAIRVGNDGEGCAWSVMSAPHEAPARTFDLDHRRVDIGRVRQTESEVDDAAALSRVRSSAVQRDDIVLARRIQEHQRAFPKQLRGAEHLVIEALRAFEVLDRVGVPEESAEFIGSLRKQFRRKGTLTDKQVGALNKFKTSALRRENGRG